MPDTSSVRVSGRRRRPPTRLGARDALLLAGVVVLAIALTVGATIAVPALPLAVLMLGALGGLGMLVLAYRRFDRLVLVLLATRPLIDLVGAGGTLSPSVLVGLVFLAAGLIWLVDRGRRGLLAPWSPAAIGLTLLVVAAAISCLVSASPAVSVIATAKLAAAILMFIVLEQSLRTRVLSVRQVMTAVGISAACVTLMAVGQAVTGTGFYDEDIGLTRSYLPFVHPNVLAKYLDVVLLAAVGYALLGPPAWRRHFTVAAAAIGGALIFTYARVGWATAAVAALYLLWRRDRRAVPVAIVGGLVIALGVPSVYERIAELWSAKPPAAGVPANSLEWRYEYWQHLIPMARISPINGLGYNMIQIVGGQDLYAHNVWVQTYVEMGLFGIGALLAAIAGIAITVRQTLRNTPSHERSAEVHIAVSVAISLFIMMQTENLLSENTTLWYAAAVLTCGYAAPTAIRQASRGDDADIAATSTRGRHRSVRARQGDDT